MNFGKAHVKKLGIKALKNKDEMIESLAKICDRQEANSLFERLFADEDNRDRNNFYSLKNKSYDIAMAITGAWDTEIVTNVCNWIEENKSYFGESILEIGCDCGFITTFLGSIFPDKKIIAIDRCKEGIAVAKKNAENFGLTNVDFICSDINDLNDLKVDTVLSVRTIHENIQDSRIPKGMYDFEDKAEFSYNGLKHYAEQIRGFLNENGNVISIERAQRDPFFLGWIKALKNDEFSINPQTYRELLCLEGAEYSTFQAAVYDKNSFAKSNALELFLMCASKNMRGNMPQTSGPDAEIKLLLRKGKLLEGYKVIDSDGDVFANIRLYSDRTDKTSLLMYRKEGIETDVWIYDTTYKVALRNEMQRYLKELPVKFNEAFKIEKI